MKKSKLQNKILIALLSTMVAGALLMSGCGQSTAQSSTDSTGTSSASVSVSANPSSTESTVEFSSEDKDTTYDENSSTQIILNGSSATVNGNGAKVSGSTITISSAGTYVLSGTLDDGNIVINAGKDDVVKLVLNNATIQSSTTSAIYASQCKKTVIMLNKDTVNTLSDGSNYVTSTDDESSESSDSASDSKSPNAAVFIQDDLTILGEGTLNVTGNANNGITSKDTLRISSGTINVTATHHGITGKDNLAIEGGTITVKATNGDGLRSTYSDTDDADKGHIFIQNAQITVTAGKDGIQAEKNFTMNNGTVTVTSGGGASESTQKSNNGFGMNQQSTDSTTESTKGIKAGSNLIINDGTVTVNSYDDALHCNGDMTLAGGTLELSSGDDGVHSDNILNISNGKITVKQSYEGLEANIINISGGVIDITASDDGINCSGGNDSSGFGGMDGNMQFGRGGGAGPNAQNNTGTTAATATSTSTNDSSSSTETPALNISGGTIYVDAQGDGLDSNGDVTVSGGTIIVNGTTSGGNGVLDHNGNFNITGGTMVGAGTSDMLEMPSDTSTQKTVAVLFDQAQSANSLVYITDSKGNVVAAMSPTKNYQCFIVSSEQLKEGETYTVYTGGTASGDAANGYYSNTTVSGGTAYANFTVSNAVTYVNASGVTTYSGGMGGNRGNMGGMGRQGF